MPEPRTLHQDAALTDYSVKYANEQAIWPLIMPVINVGKRSDRFFRYNKDDSYRRNDDSVGPRSNANEIDWGVSTDNFSVKDHAFADYVAQEEIDNADAGLNPLIDTTDFLNQQLDMAQEKRVADIAFTAANYPAGNKVVLSGTAQWSGAADDPLKNIMDAVEGCFIRANTLVFGAEAWMVFRRLSEVLDALRGFGSAPRGGIATAEDILKLFEVERVLVGRMRVITTKKGQTSAFGRIWGKHCAALYVEPRPSLKSITFGATFSEMQRTVMRGFDEKKGAKGAVYLKAAWNSDEKIIASDCGYLIENAVA